MNSSEMVHLLSLALAYLVSPKLEHLISPELVHLLLLKQVHLISFEPVHLISYCSSAAFPAISLGFTFFGEIFAYVTFFNPTIQVVTFGLHGCAFDFSSISVLDVT